MNDALSSTENFCHCLADILFQSAEVLTSSMFALCVRTSGMIGMPAAFGASCYRSGPDSLLETLTGVLNDAEANGILPPCDHSQVAEQLLFQSVGNKLLSRLMLGSPVDEDDLRHSVNNAVETFMRAYVLYPLLRADKVA